MKKGENQNRGKPKQGKTNIGENQYRGKPKQGKPKIVENQTRENKNR